MVPCRERTNYVDLLSTHCPVMFSSSIKIQVGLSHTLRISRKDHATSFGYSISEYSQSCVILLVENGIMLATLSCVLARGHR